MTERHYYELRDEEARLLDQTVERLKAFRDVRDRFVETQGDGFARHDAVGPAAELVDALLALIFAGDAR